MRNSTIKKTTNPLHRLGFHYAWAGIHHAFTQHPNFQIHAFVSLVVFLLAIILELSAFKLTMLIFAVTLGLVVEMFNTAIEAIVDMITQDWNYNAKIAKDVAAGAMLITAIGTAIIGALLLGPEIMKLLEINN